jgi:uncharacterized protein (TIRG00374 family)
MLARSRGPVARAVTIGLVVGVPASIFFLWLAFRGANFDSVWETAQGADVALVGLALLSIGAVYAFQAARWRLLAASDRPGLLGFAEMVLGSIAANNLLPGRVGELFRVRWLSVAAPMASGRAFATVGLDRGSDVVALFALLLVALPFVAWPTWVDGIVFGSAVLVVVMFVLLFAARGYVRVHERERRERGRLRRAARDVVDTLAEPLGRRRVARALVLSLLAWSAFALAAWFVARSIGVGLDPLDCVFVTAVVNLGVAIPSSPGFLGTYQWLAVSSLGAVGVERDEALAFSILLHASWYIPTTLLGGLLLLFRLDWGLRQPR